MGFNSKVKSKAYPKQEIYNILRQVKNKEARVYLAMTYFMANRSGELLPYLHYKYKYAKDKKGKLVTYVASSGREYPLIKSRKPCNISLGVDVRGIVFKYDKQDNVRLILMSVPVFKVKEIAYEVAYIVRKNNPFFEEILGFVEERRVVARKYFNKKPVYLFGDIKPNRLGHYSGRVVERFFWSFKKRVQYALKRIEPGFRVHSLRVSRATSAADESGGDIFYVQGVTRHRDLKNLEQYVKPVRMEEKVEKYA